MRQAGLDLFKMMTLGASGDLGPFTIYTSKRKSIVAYLKSPPKEAPTPLQVHRRNQFRLCGFAWDRLGWQKKADWRHAASRAGLRITGYNLFVYYHTTRDITTIRTIERQSRISLVT